MPSDHDSRERRHDPAPRAIGFRHNHDLIKRNLKGFSMDHKSDWYDLIVGNGNVNEGLARIIGFILAVIVILSLIFWMI